MDKMKAEVTERNPRVHPSRPLEGRRLTRESDAAGYLLFVVRPTREARRPPTPDPRDVICPHQHFKYDVIDRDILSRKQHLNLLCTPKGYRWIMLKGDDDPKYETIDDVEYHPCKVVKKKPGKTYVHNILAELWSLLTPEMITRMKEMLMAEFGLTEEAAVDFICRSRHDTMQTADRIKMRKRGDEDDLAEEGDMGAGDPKLPRVIFEEKLCDKSQFAVGIHPCHIKEFSRVVSSKFAEYVVAMMCARRNNRHRRMAEVVLNGLCNLTGEKTTLDNPKNRLHKILTVTSDRIALWLAQNMDDEDSKRNRRRRKEDEALRKRKLEKQKEQERRQKEKDKMNREIERNKKRKAKEDEELERQKKEEEEKKKEEREKKRQELERFREEDKKKKEEDKKKAKDEDERKKQERKEKHEKAKQKSEAAKSSAGKPTSSDQKPGSAGKDQKAGGGQKPGTAKPGKPKQSGTSSGGARPPSKDRSPSPGRDKDDSTKPTTEPSGGGEGNETAAGGASESQTDPGKVADSSETGGLAAGGSEAGGPGTGAAGTGGEGGTPGEPTDNKGADQTGGSEEQQEQKPATTSGGPGEAGQDSADAETGVAGSAAEADAGQTTTGEPGGPGDAAGAGAGAGQPTSGVPEEQKEEKPITTTSEPGQEVAGAETGPGGSSSGVAVSADEAGAGQPTTGEPGSQGKISQPGSQTAAGQPASEEQLTPELEKVISVTTSQIGDTTPVPTPRQETLQDILSKELEKRVQPKDQETMDIIREVASKTATWIDQNVKEAEIAYGSRETIPKPAPVTQKPKGSVFVVKKIDPSRSNYDVRIATHTEAGMKIRAVRKKLSGRNVSSAPSDPSDPKMWAKWAVNASQMADDWGHWIDKTIQDAEDKAIQFQSKAKDGVTDPYDEEDWNRFVASTTENANFFRQQKKTLEEAAKEWKVRTQ